MSAPLVSVCLPNLNTRPFLEERLDSILGQTYENWELVISDNYSDDGAWEFFRQLAERDRRVSIEQAPREGLYPNWNNCLRRSRGEYVYFATSDDTMAVDCLAKLVASLEAHRDCDLAHCPFVIIDEGGSEVHDGKWPARTTFAHGIEELAHRPHIRRAPYDGLIHLAGQHVVLSITQLLIRRSLFSRTGNFSSRWGSVSDFNWEMKAGLLANVIHVPDTWGSWRQHPAQATASVDVFSPERARKVEEMIRDAVETCRDSLPSKVVDGLESHWLAFSSEMRLYYAGLRERRRAADRRAFQLARFLGGTNAVRSQILGRALGRPRWPDTAPTEIRIWLQSLLGSPVIDALPRGSHPVSSSSADSGRPAREG
jgi:glycosyltransferase involved in cell wall biosynthesis